MAPPSAGENAEQTIAAAPPAELARAVDDHNARAEVSADAPPRLVEAAPAPGVTAFVDGRFVDASGRGIRGVRVKKPVPIDGRVVESDDQGDFVLTMAPGSRFGRQSFEAPSVASNASRRSRSNVGSRSCPSRKAARRCASGASWNSTAARTTGPRSGVLKGPPFDTDPQRVPRQAVAAWERAADSLHALCTASGVRYVHALQPALHDPEGKVLTASELATGKISESLMRGVTLGYPLLREADQRLSAAGVRFVDLTGVFRGLEGDVYYDSCHFGERGNLLVADHLARAILEAL